MFSCLRLYRKLLTFVLNNSRFKILKLTLGTLKSMKLNQLKTVLKILFLNKTLTWHFGIALTKYKYILVSNVLSYDHLLYVSTVWSNHRSYLFHLTEETFPLENFWHVFL